MAPEEQKRYIRNAITLLRKNLGVELSFEDFVVSEKYNSISLTKPSCNGQNDISFYCPYEIFELNATFPPVNLGHEYHEDPTISQMPDDKRILMRVT